MGAIDPPPNPDPPSTLGSRTQEALRGKEEAHARTTSGRPVAAIVLPDEKLSTAALESELATLTEALRAAPLKLTYGLTARPDRPLEVERVPDNELV